MVTFGFSIPPSAEGHTRCVSWIQEAIGEPTVVTEIKQADGDPLVIVHTPCCFGSEIWETLFQIEKDGEMHDFLEFVGEGVEVYQGTEAQFMYLWILRVE